MLDFLPPGWEHAAKPCGALQRKRVIREPAVLLRLVLSHTGAGLPWQRIVETAESLGLGKMAKSSLWERFLRVGPWLEWILERLVSPTIQRPEIAGWRVQLVDASTVCGPANNSELRLHYCLDLESLSCRGLNITDNHVAESFEHFAASPGDLLVGDRIYAKAKGIAHVRNTGGHVLVRLGRTSLSLRDAEGQRLDWLALLRQTPEGQIAEVCAKFQDPDSGAWINGRIVGTRLPQEKAEAARQRCQKTAQRKKSKLSAKTLEAATCMCLFTTAPADELSAAVAMEVYRVRWQAEVGFKRLKSILHLGQLREITPTSARIWLQGKMVYALLLDKCLSRAGLLSPR